MMDNASNIGLTRAGAPMITPGTKINGHPGGYLAHQCVESRMMFCSWNRLGNEGGWRHKRPERNMRA